MKTRIAIYCFENLLKAITAFVIILILYSSCQEKKEKTINTKKIPHFQIDKKTICSIAKCILKEKDNENIWNLSEIDTTDIFMVEDYFTNNKTKNKLVLIGGEAGMSSGTADNLLILFEYSNTPKVIWAGQMGVITPTDIQDLNNDGIKEIVCNSSMMYMGECSDNYIIFNFKNKTYNLLYSVRSSSIIDCGLEEIRNDLYKKGDTLETNFICSIINNSNKIHKLKQIRSYKIHNGGDTDFEILKNLKTIIDTSLITIK